MLFAAYVVLVNIVSPNIATGTNINPLFNNTFLFFNSIIIPPFFLEQLINYSIFWSICQIQETKTPEILYFSSVLRFYIFKPNSHYFFNNSSIFSLSTASLPE